MASLDTASSTLGDSDAPSGGSGSSGGSTAPLTVVSLGATDFVLLALLAFVVVFVLPRKVRALLRRWTHGSSAGQPPPGPKKQL